MTHPLHGKGAHSVLRQSFCLQQCYFNVAIQLSVIRPILTTLNLDTQQKDLYFNTTKCFQTTSQNYKLQHLNCTLTFASGAVLFCTNQHKA